MYCLEIMDTLILCVLFQILVHNPSTIRFSLPDPHYCLIFPFSLRSVFSYSFFLAFLYFFFSSILCALSRNLSNIVYLFISLFFSHLSSRHAVFHPFSSVCTFIQQPATYHLCLTCFWFFLVSFFLGIFFFSHLVCLLAPTYINVLHIPFYIKRH